MTSKKISFYVLLLLILSNSYNFLIAQDNLNCTLAGVWGEGPTQTVDISGNYIFLNNGRYLEILDNTDPDNPVQVSKYLSRGYIYDIKVVDTLVYLAIDNIGLSIVNITDISNPAEIGYFKIQGFYLKIEIHNNKLYLFTNSVYNLYIIDISNPHYPIEIKRFKLASGFNIKVKNDFLFLAARDKGLIIYKFSDTDTLNEVFSNDTLYGYDVDIKDNLMSIATGKKLLIYDITDSSNPVLKGEFAESYLLNCTFYNNMIVTGTYHLWIIDISDSSNPYNAGAYQINGRIEEIAIKDNYIYTAAYADGLKVYNYNNLDNVFLNCQYKTHGTAFSVAHKNEYTYLTQFPTEIVILNTSDTKSPVAVNTISGFKKIRTIKIKENYLICSDYGIKIYDISDPVNPVLISTLDFNLPSYEFLIKNNTIYLASEKNGLTIIDISDINNPAITGEFKTDNTTYGIDIKGDYAFLANRDKGLIIVDISVPSNPMKINTFDQFNNLKSVKIIDDYAYVGGEYSGIKIIDISDVYNPVYIKSLQNRRVYGIKLIDDLIYVSSGYAGAYVYDIKEPANPKKIGFYNTTGEVRDMVIDNTTLYLADYNTGLSIVDFDTTYICPELVVNSTVQNISCFGQCDGNIVINNVDNAILPLQYNWSNGTAGYFISGLCKGTYTVTIIDSKNCQIIDTFYVDEPSAIIIENIEKINITDTNDKGSIRLDVSGGTPGYSFSWTGPDGFTSHQKNIDNLKEGCYTLTVIDANDCTVVSDQICIEDKTTSLSEVEDNTGICIFPNPSGGIIRLSSADKNHLLSTDIYVEIFSASGQAVFSKKISQNQDIDISKLDEGVYYLLVKTNCNVFVKRLLLIK